MTYSRWWARATFAILDVGACALGQLLQEECSLKTLLIDRTVDATQLCSVDIVGVLDLLHALLKLDALLAVGAFDGGWEA